MELYQGTADFYMKGIWSLCLFNGDYLSISEGAGSCEYLFHETPGTKP